MKQEDSKITINLSSTAKESIKNIFFKWAVNAGRIIIIVTELIALGALLYRFVIDRQIVDLHDQIKREEIVVKSQEKREEDFRSLQDRLTNSKKFTDETNLKVKTLQAMFSAVKERGFSTSKLNLSQDSIIIEGTSPSVFNLVEFINSLKKQNGVTAINLNEVKSEKGGISFNMSIKLKSQK